MRKLFQTVPYDARRVYGTNRFRTPDLVCSTISQKKDRDHSPPSEFSSSFHFQISDVTFSFEFMHVCCLVSFVEVFKFRVCVGRVDVYKRVYVRDIYILGGLWTKSKSYTDFST